MVPRAETFSNKIATSPTITGVAGGVSPSASPQGSHVSIASNHGSESSTQKKFETEVPVAAYLCEYNQTQFRETYVDDLAEFFNTHEDELGVIRWIHICSHDNPQTALMLLDGKYRLHPLAIEDVCYTPQRPKIDRYDWMLFIVAHYPQLKDEPGGLELSLNQVSIFFLKPSNVVITFEEPSASGRDGRWSHVVRERLTFSTDGIRSRDLSFLVYSILDALIDSYFPVLEFYGERIEEIEAELMDEPKPDLIKVRICFVRIGASGHISLGN
jgi:magnesium transporter